MSALEKKLARDVAKLRKLVMQLRYCHDEALCVDCEFGPYHSRCHASRLELIDKVLKATKKKPRGESVTNDRAPRTAVQIANEFWEWLVQHPEYGENDGFSLSTVRSVCKIDDLTERHKVNAAVLILLIRGDVQRKRRGSYIFSIFGRLGVRHGPKRQETPQPLIESCLVQVRRLREGTPPSTVPPRAEFLWGYAEGSAEALGYEFANAMTEVYRREVWDALVEKLRGGG